MLDVAIIGAGPYGLSVGAHVQADKSLKSGIFGMPMDFWEHRMPKGMHLRSPWDGSHFADPAGQLSLDAFVRECGNHLPRPIPLERFVDYGKWFQRRAVPDVDNRRVLNVERNGGSFHLHMETGSDVEARQVVVAAGIQPFMHYPEEFRRLPRSMATHTSDHGPLEQYAGRSVIVVGAGQSALETAALLHEAGAVVEVIARREHIRFLLRSNVLHQLGPLSSLMYSKADVGPAGVSRIVDMPGLYRHLPRAIHDAWRTRCLRPAGSSWLEPRLRDVKLSLGTNVVVAAPRRGRVYLLLNDGTERAVDHVILGTGYRVDISRYPFLNVGLVAAVHRVNGYPCLSPAFESSVPGLHFVGAPAAWTFGPLMCFVAGTRFAAERLSRHLRAGRRISRRD